MILSPAFIIQEALISYITYCYTLGRPRPKFNQLKTEIHESINEGSSSTAQN